LKCDRADASRLVELSRGHREIENRPHFVRDVTVGGDSCRVQACAAPQVLAALRKTVSQLLEGVKAASKAAATRTFAARPFNAVALLFTSARLSNGPGEPGDHP
jgi:hypothetical protein